jgi:hypothetical protein
MDTKPIHKRIPQGLIKLQFAGDLILARCPDKDLSGLFRRYETLFETFANMEKEERFVNYKMLNALMLTSFAKKENDPELKKDLFNKKNELFFDIANNPSQRKKVSFKYLSSKNFRIIKYCDECTKKNTEAGLKRFNSKFCKKCDFDRQFYNVVSMFHSYDDGESCIFLSNDLVEKLPIKKIKGQGKLDDFTEEAKYKKYHYTVKNLDAIALESVLEMYKKILNK